MERTISSLYTADVICIFHFQTLRCVPGRAADPGGEQPDPSVENTPGPEERVENPDPDPNVQRNQIWIRTYLSILFRGDFNEGVQT